MIERFHLWEVVYWQLWSLKIKKSKALRHLLNSIDKEERMHHSFVFFLLFFTHVLRQGFDCKYFAACDRALDLPGYRRSLRHYSVHEICHGVHVEWFFFGPRAGKNSLALRRWWWWRITSARALDSFLWCGQERWWKAEIDRICQQVCGLTIFGIPALCIFRSFPKNGNEYGTAELAMILSCRPSDFRDSIWRAIAVLAKTTDDPKVFLLLFQIIANISRFGKLSTIFGRLISRNRPPRWKFAPALRHSDVPCTSFFGIQQLIHVVGMDEENLRCARCGCCADHSRKGVHGSKKITRDGDHSKWPDTTDQ